MPLLICDENAADELIAKRRASGGDRFDEVWDGVYVMSPTANNEHQSLASEMTSILKTVIDWQGLGLTLVGANVSDREEDWTQNYRVPDVLVFRKDTRAIDRGSHWYGGPDLALEIVSRGDRTLEKLGFYAKVGTQELLVIDRHPWKLTLYRMSSASRLEPCAVSSPDQPYPIQSVVFPVQFQLLSAPLCIQVLDPGGRLIRPIAIS